MSAAELKWAFLREVMVTIETDPIKKTRGTYRSISEIVYKKDRSGTVCVYAVCEDLYANSVTRATMEDLEFFAKGDEERCHRELTEDTQSAAVS